MSLMFHRGFAGGSSVKVPACQCRRDKRCRFNPWVRKIPWRRKWRSTEQPSSLQSIGSQCVRHDWSDLACMRTGSVWQKGFLQLDHLISLPDHVDSAWHWWVNVGSSVVPNVEYTTLVGCGGRRYAVVWMFPKTPMLKSSPTWWSV